MGVCVDWLGTVTSIKSSWIVVYLWVYVLTGLGQSLQYKVTGLSFIGGGGGGRVYVDWLGTATSIKSSWIVIYLWVYVLTGLA